jgi:hypothetical protein
VTAAGYIATDREGAAIYGIGATADEAIADARRESNDGEGQYVVVAATAELLDHVREHGGASWAVAFELTDRSGEPVSFTCAAEYDDPDRYIAKVSE